jgi:nicotinate phosphoribosyltransferase
MGRFETVDEDTIRKGGCTDIYFVRSEEVLEADDMNPCVVMEVTAGALPDEWAVFCGLNDVSALLEDVNVDIDAMPEGTVFHPHEPVLRITGRYRDFARYETAILGFLCHASGIASAAAHIRCIAGDRQVYSFGSRRQHPAIAAMVERSAWIGGVDGASNTAAPPEIPLAGTMPHAFVMCYPQPSDAFRAFSRHASPGVPRIMLCDTFCDEKRESLAAAAVGAEGVRLDTPRSRRGDMREILEEVRWELDSAGHEKVKIFLSGGVNREDIIRYRDIVDAFGVGGAIANAPVIDFALDIVEREGVHCAKRGKRGGVKQVYLMPSGERVTLPAGREPPAGGVPLLVPFIREGRVVRGTDMAEARERVLTAIPALSGEREKE